ncbi:MAG TPA: hypothetical protein VJK05_04060 [archaeon]|nr:hypothetical protein [archaeon]
MATIKRIDDEIRLNVLDSLLQPRAVSPNVKQIQKTTGYHKATIKSSLDFLTKEGVLSGFGPKINVRKFGYKLEAQLFLQVDLSEKELFQKFLQAIEEDPHVHMCSSIIGSGNWNILLKHLYKDIESFHQETQKKYYEKIPGIMKLIKDRQPFYSTEPFYKNIPRTKSIIEMIKREKGMS